MSYSINDANNDLLGATHGLTINQIANIYGLHWRAGRHLINDVDPIETVNKVLAVSPFFYQVWDYACPADLKGNRIIDIAPQAERYPNQVLPQTFNQNFDLTKNYTYTNNFTIQWNNAVKTIRVQDATLPQGTLMDSCNAVNNWTTGGTASNLTVNNINFASGSGSLSFNLTTGTGSISETLSAQTDLSSYLNQGTFFYYLYLPIGSDLTSTEIRWGSSPSNYYSVVSTSTAEGTVFQTGWNLIQANWLGCTVVGSPVNTAINYLYIGVTSTTSLTGVCVDNIIINMGLYRTIEYYSKYLYRDGTTGVFKERPTAVTDLLNLDTDSYNMYFNILAYYACQQLQGLDAMFFDANFYLGEYEKERQKYAAKQPSQVQKSRQEYYQPNKGGYRFRNRNNLY